MKKIKISGKEYEMTSSAYTQFAYKNETGRSFLKDINTLAEADLSDLEIVMDLCELLLDIAYVMIKEANPDQVTNKDDFYKSIKKVFDDPTWINEVVELAISPISPSFQPKAS